jgi:hypothetical protein
MLEYVSGMIEDNKVVFILMDAQSSSYRLQVNRD